MQISLDGNVQLYFSHPLFFYSAGIMQIFKRLSVMAGEFCLKSEDGYKAALSEKNRCGCL